MLHRLQVGLRRVLAVPYPDDGVPPRRVEPVEVGVVLQGVDPRAVHALALIADHVRDLRGLHQIQWKGADIQAKKGAFHVY